MTGTRLQIPGHAAARASATRWPWACQSASLALADLVADGVDNGLHSVAAPAEDLWIGQGDTPHLIRT